PQRRRGSTPSSHARRCPTCPRRARRPWPRRTPAPAATLRCRPTQRSVPSAGSPSRRGSEATDATGTSPLGQGDRLEYPASDREAMGRRERKASEVSSCDREAIARSEPKASEVSSCDREAIARSEPKASEVSSCDREAIARSEPKASEVSSCDREAIARSEP